MKERMIKNISELLKSCDIVTIKAVYSAVKSMTEKGEAHERKNHKNDRRA